MEGTDVDPTRYGRSFADVYDDWYADAFDTDAAVAALVELAAGAPVLELGAGTGRLAIPLAATGLEVVALDASIEMLDRLQANDRAGLVEPLWADMSSFAAALPDRRFGLVVCAFNTILNLADDAAIAACLADVTEVLQPGGIVVIEAIVPADPIDVPSRSLTPAHVRTDAVVFVETILDPSTGRLEGRHVEIGEGAVRTRPWSIVLRGPEALDAAATEAGLRLRERWSDWSATPFGDDSDTHVSIHSLAP